MIYIYTHTHTTKTLRMNERSLSYIYIYIHTTKTNMRFKDVNQNLDGQGVRSVTSNWQFVHIWPEFKSLSDNGKERIFGEMKWGMERQLGFLGYFERI